MDDQDLCRTCGQRVLGPYCGVCGRRVEAATGAPDELPRHQPAPRLPSPAEPKDIPAEQKDIPAEQKNTPDAAGWSAPGASWTPARSWSRSDAQPRTAVPTSVAWADQAELDAIDSDATSGGMAPGATWSGEQSPLRRAAGWIGAYHTTCPTCGAAIGRTAFCPSCGARLEPLQRFATARAVDRCRRRGHRRRGRGCGRSRWLVRRVDPRPAEPGAHLRRVAGPSLDVCDRWLRCAGLLLRIEPSDRRGGPTASS